ncbi:uncharacterized protein TNCV_1952131 [Trichonephila clavipes]|nr:uncharacterized protein TNCV_1952131 [Trichonephila clavipes]
MLEKVIENWTSRLDYIRASSGSPMPEIIFKMAVGSLVVRASDSRPEGLGSMLDVTKYPPSAHGFTCRNCGGGDRGRVAIYRPFGEVSLSLNRTVTCVVLKANDRRTSCPCHDEFRGPRSDYVRQEQWFSPPVRGAPATGFITDRFKTFWGTEDPSVEFLQKQQWGKENTSPLDKIEAEFNMLYGEQKSDSLCLGFGMTANLIIHQAKRGRKCAEEFANNLNFDRNSTVNQHL